MASPDELADWLQKLSLKQYSKKECTDAINGQAIPTALGLPLLRLCTIRGIRYHDSFATELRKVAPEFTRALNARDIMSNRIPTIDSDEEIPYCIWHPHVASEETYRQLVKRYPAMIYQVGRACAVAGYNDLYDELDILPEVHIAEEARECGNVEIYSRIMSNKIKYDVMNDYQRSVNLEDPDTGHLNGDTAVLRMLDKTQAFGRADDPDEEIFLPSLGYRENIFDITEDMCIAAKYREGSGYTPRKAVQSGVEIKLLTGPLPLDLPVVEKDLLICMAAYYGDVDRYVRLRRPKMVPSEIHCCVRGVYHNIMFAVWWSKQSTKIDAGYWLDQAIDARFIMSNVLSRVNTQPYLIWYPNLASPSTYKELARLQPEMLPQVLRACIVADYQELFDELIVKMKPDDALLKVARDSRRPYYEKALERRMAEVGMDKVSDFDDWKIRFSHHDMQYSSRTVYQAMCYAGPVTAFEDIYNGVQCDAKAVELLACLPDEWRIPKDYDGSPSRCLTYRDGYRNLQNRFASPSSEDIEELEDWARSKI